VRTAVLRIRQGTGFGLRRRASSDRPDSDGWDLVEVAFSDAGWYADYIASFGSDVVVIEPVDLREAVIRRLKGALT
ncbi:MAG: WYL domain-containing protein, partial [Nocardiopsaceae bacterium]|jgi:proteasome accessory factor B|nr:WYL domain-containing protein [Nocardiopsaceae bacterium]